MGAELQRCEARSRRPGFMFRVLLTDGIAREAVDVLQGFDGVEVTSLLVEID